MKNPSNRFGIHLTLDGYGGDFDLLNSQENVYACLDKLPDIIKMHKLSAPFVFAAPDVSLKDPGGWSGVVIISESHICIHTFPARGFVSVDVYTCGEELDVDSTILFFRNRFNLDDTEINVIDRGTKYPFGLIEHR